MEAAPSLAPSPEHNGGGKDCRPEGQPSHSLMIASETTESALAERSRLQRNKLLGGSSMTLVFIGIAGFCPAYVVNFTTGHLYFDAVGRINYPDAMAAEERFGFVWHLLLGIHAFTAVLWTILAAFQVFTGATGEAGDNRKSWHRVTGRVAAGACALVSIEAMSLQLLKPPSFLHFSIFTTACMMLVNLSLGILFARSKRFAEHKSAMTWTAAWTAGPGLVRLTFYLVKFSVGGQCRPEQMAFYSWGATFIMSMFLIPAFIMLKEIKTKLFIGNMCTITLVLWGDLMDARVTMSEGDWCWQ